MKVILDTHLLIWAAESVSLLPTAAREVMVDPASTLIFSVASIWEVAIKGALKRDDFEIDPTSLRRGLVDNGYIELPIIGVHAAAVVRLPLIHRDPFDRLLIAQSIIEGVTLLTADPVLARYPAPVRLV